MKEITAENAVAELRERGLLLNDVAARAESLSGGVSNVVIRISVESGADMVLKQSREQLRTKAEWKSRLDRIWREAAVQRVLSEILPRGTIPRVIHEDRENFLYVMEAVEPDHVVWKTALLAGHADLEIVKCSAETLATIHSRTAGDACLQQQFCDLTAFDELRLDPFYRFVANRHPSLSDSLLELVQGSTNRPLCLVLADFSPKNILLTRSGIVLVDFETAHFGDPAFDLGFFLSHLVLKAVHHFSRDRSFVQFPRLAWSAYKAAYKPTVPQHGLEIDSLASRTVAHLQGCLLARIDGKSPVDYLDEQCRHHVREFCLDLFATGPYSLEETFDRLDAGLAELASRSNEG